MSGASIELAPGYTISRVVKGGWHLAGGHGAFDREQAIRDMAEFVDAGITTFDCADIYTGVEALIGAFRRAYPDHARRAQIHTKFVPDLARLGSLTAADVAASVDRSLHRLGMERLDHVQFHWWDYAVPGYVEVGLALDALRRAGKIGSVGVTNFDVHHLAELCAAGVPVRSHLLQYSLIDSRPENGMAEFCRRHGIGLLCYGAVAGGFFSERWLGAAEPGADFANRSLTKYRLVIDEFGGWSLFQALLRQLATIATKHGTDIATTASAAMLGRPGVAAVVIGAVNRAHLARNASTTSIALDDDDRAALGAITSLARGPKGECYELERQRVGPHGRIMKYDLNSGHSEAAKEARA
jgi:aryl-alcohol dehydrogenase-like predicted oxidoreductase